MILLQDQVRSDARSTLQSLREAGIERIVLASGDLLHIAQSIGQNLGVDQILGDLTPEEKVAVVRREATMRPVMMVGDGVNDVRLSPLLMWASQWEPEVQQRLRRLQELSCWLTNCFRSLKL